MLKSEWLHEKEYLKIVHDYRKTTYTYLSKVLD